MGHIADILEGRGQTDEAFRIRREEQPPVYERLGDARSTPICRANIGNALMKKSERTKAELTEAHEHLQWALATAEKPNTRGPRNCGRSCGSSVNERE